jgi:2-oxoglutarate dehydrogenase E1 component
LNRSLVGVFRKANERTTKELERVMAKDGAAPQDSRSAPERSVLSGPNIQYLEALYARFAKDPASLSPEWRDFFEREGDRANGSQQTDGPSWARKDWPPTPNGELTAAMDGNWGDAEQILKTKIEARAPAASTQEDVRQATKDSLRALMLIRAYRIRGHLIADLDPLGLQKKEIHPELDPATLGFTEADMDRPIFIDHVLGLETATLR